MTNGAWSLPVLQLGRNDLHCPMRWCIDEGAHFVTANAAERGWIVYPDFLLDHRQRDDLQSLKRRELRAHRHVDGP
jgi:hypothetical protein